jgi:CspA family cold shock protein
MWSPSIKAPSSAKSPGVACCCCLQKGGFLIGPSTRLWTVRDAVIDGWGRYLPLRRILAFAYGDGTGRTWHRMPSPATPSTQFHREHIMALGTVKWFNVQKGYGFIQPRDGGKDVFVHISAVEQSGLTALYDGQEVSFDLEPGRQGRMSAVNIKAS